MLSGSQFELGTPVSEADGGLGLELAKSPVKKKAPNSATASGGLNAATAIRHFCMKFL
jgi:hypothetical protein